MFVLCPVLYFKQDTYVRLQVEAGDVLLKVNGTDVNRFTTREGKEPTNLQMRVYFGRPRLVAFYFSTLRFTLSLKSPFVSI